MICRHSATQIAPYACAGNIYPAPVLACVAGDNVRSWARERRVVGVALEDAHAYKRTRLLLTCIVNVKQTALYFRRDK